MILLTTKTLIENQGMLNTTTKHIADHCGIAHGTIFSHFNTRDLLFSTVIKRELIRVAEKLHKLDVKNRTLEALLKAYFLLLAKEEPLMTALSREFPFLSEEIKNEIITTETIIKKFLYDKIQAGIDSKTLKAVNITVALSFLFGAIQLFLCRKEYYVKDDESVIRMKSDELIQTFISLFKQK